MALLASTGRTVPDKKAIASKDGAAAEARELLAVSSGEVNSIRRLSTTGGMPAGFSLGASGSFGYFAAGLLDDPNGDGVVDLAVRARTDDDGASNAGAVRVVFPTAVGGASLFNKLSATSGMPTGFSLDAGDGFGRSAARLGDLNGDGVIDFAVSTFGDGDGAAGSGAVYVIFLTAAGGASSFNKPSATSGMSAGVSLGASDFFDSSVAGPGDACSARRSRPLAIYCVVDVAVGA